MYRLCGMAAGAKRGREQRQAGRQKGASGTNPKHIVSSSLLVRGDASVAENEIYLNTRLVVTQYTHFLYVRRREQKESDKISGCRCGVWGESE